MQKSNQTGSNALAIITRQTTYAKTAKLFIETGISTGWHGNGHLENGHVTDSSDLSEAAV